MNGMVFPPGTILQHLYLKERLKNHDKGRFVEIGAGEGHISSCLLSLGWTGTAYELDRQSAARCQEIHRVAIEAGRYAVANADWLEETRATAAADLIVSCMVLEHLDDAQEARYFQKCRDSLSPSGIGVLLVPGSVSDWGIEDRIAGHYRRYSFSSLSEKLTRAGCKVTHIAGLTFPIANLLLPLSNSLVDRNERGKLGLDLSTRTRASGRRRVFGKTHFPGLAILLFNEFVMYPFHIVQKAFSRSPRALVIYAEFTKADK